MRSLARESTKAKITRLIANSPGEILLRADFNELGTPSRVTRALSSLVTEGKLVRLGYGIYAKAQPSSISGKPIPRKVLEELTPEIFEQLKVPISYGKAITDYISGNTTQLPTALVINTGRQRISRKISLGGREVKYEKNLRKRSARNSGSQR